MKERLSQNIKVGLLVIAGTFFFIAALYFIGSKDNLFTPGFRISAAFKDVKGLLIGNNVRFSGINIVTVKELIIVNDTTVRVVMNIQESARKFIRKNTLASVGTDGLIGNKIVILTSNLEKGEEVKNGDEIKSVSPFDTDANLKNLEDIGDQIKTIASNLESITHKLNESDALWGMLGDSSMATEMRSTFAYIHQIGVNGAELTNDLRIIVKKANKGSGNLAVLLNDSTLSGLAADLRQMMKDIKAGKGAVGTLISDERAAENIQETLANIKVLSDSLAFVGTELTSFSKSMNQSANVIISTLSDSSFIKNLNSTMKHISNSSIKLEENLEGLKHSFLLRRYFRKLDRINKKAEK